MIDDNLARRRVAPEDVQLFAFLVAASLAVVCCVCFAVHGVAGSGGIGPVELEHRLNPNDAPVAGLVGLPGIGVARAEAIVAYRDRFNAEGNSGPAFRDCGDLDKVKGIGPKTVEALCEWLRFD